MHYKNILGCYTIKLKIFEFPKRNIFLSCSCSHDIHLAEGVKVYSFLYFFLIILFCCSSKTYKKIFGGRGRYIFWWVRCICVYNICIQLYSQGRVHIYAFLHPHIFSLLFFHFVQPQTTLYCFCILPYFPPSIQKKRPH